MEENQELMIVDKEVVWEVSHGTMVMISNECHYSLKVVHDTFISVPEDEREPCLSELNSV